MPQVNVFARRGGVLHGGPSAFPPLPSPPRDRQLPADAPLTFQVEEEEQGAHGGITLEDLLRNPETREVPWIDHKGRTHFGNFDSLFYFNLLIII